MARTWRYEPGGGHSLSDCDQLIPEPVTADRRCRIRPTSGGVVIKWSGGAPNQQRERSTAQQPPLPDRSTAQESLRAGARREAATTLTCRYTAIYTLKRNVSGVFDLD